MNNNNDNYTPPTKHCSFCGSAFHEASWCPTRSSSTSRNTLHTPPPKSSNGHPHDSYEKSRENANEIMLLVLIIMVKFMELTAKGTVAIHKELKGNLNEKDGYPRESRKNSFKAATYIGGVYTAIFMTLGIATDEDAQRILANARNEVISTFSRIVNFNKQDQDQQKLYCEGRQPIICRPQ